ncbi:MAG TPA: MFS transporter [Dyella sp.]|uniref:MFS transporter n=1 Tax=Dyella sp. TaxID=1869338 RepID=UPI002B76F639|nr:MFS transporter [Dyella sp.]HTV85091.1 MFS transporter [Dyella sp.]
MNLKHTEVGLMDSGELRLPSSTCVLCLCQALNLTAAIVSVTVAALVGEQLAPHPVWSTLPYGVQFAVVALLTYPASVFMRRFGRRAGFMLGATMLIAAGCVGFAAIERSRFAGLVLAHGLLGAYVAFANFYRFAAVDRLSAALRPRGLSLVVAGGVLAAFIGPWLSMGLGSVEGYAPFALCYASFCAIGFCTMILLGLWKRAPAMPTTNAASTKEIEQHVIAPIAAAVFSSASAYLIMNLLMVQASLVMNSMGVGFHAGTWAIQGHVLAMFVPSFATGLVINRLGYRATLCGGFLLLIAATLLAFVGLGGFSAMLAGLILLGVGWNFSYIGGGALLAKYLTDENRHRMQGINDSIIAISATVGAFVPALLQALVGWRNTNLLCLLICIFGFVLAWHATGKASLD